MKELIGKKVREIYVDSEFQTYLKFVTDQGDLHYYADGDCCSESYFAEILGVNNLLQQKYAVLSVEKIQLGESEGTRQESDSIYGIKINFSEPGKYYGPSCALIIFRNSSNGYYGGSCDYWDMENANGYMKKLISKVKWQKVESIDARRNI